MTANRSRQLAATPAGMTVTVKGEVTAVDGRKLSFRVEAWDATDKITEGTHESTVIDAAKFNARIAGKLGAGRAA